MCSARAVWKPLEWAEMPRMAWKETGRPTKLWWRSPFMSVQGWSISIASSKATRPISAASPRIVSAGTPVSAATASGAYFVEIFVGQMLEDRNRETPVFQFEAPRERGARALRAEGHRPFGHRLEDQRPAVASRANSP
jgi:hypothetical protein